MPINHTTIISVKEKGSETVKPNSNQSISKNKLFSANFMQIGQ